MRNRLNKNKYFCVKHGIILEKDLRGLKISKASAITLVTLTLKGIPFSKASDDVNVTLNKWNSELDRPKKEV